MMKSILVAALSLLLATPALAQVSISGDGSANTVTQTQTNNISGGSSSESRAGSGGGSGLNPGTAVGAPGLAAGGTNVCLGAFSFGLGGPMAGISFGKTVRDEGCEQRSNAVILYGWGYHSAALALVCMNGDVAKVMGASCPAVYPDTQKPAPVPSGDVQPAPYRNGTPQGGE